MDKLAEGTWILTLFLIACIICLLNFIDEAKNRIARIMGAFLVLVCVASIFLLFYGVLSLGAK